MMMTLRGWWWFNGRRRPRRLIEYRRMVLAEELLPREYFINSLSNPHGMWFPSSSSRPFYSFIFHGE